MTLVKRNNLLKSRAYVIKHDHANINIKIGQLMKNDELKEYTDIITVYSFSSSFFLSVIGSCLSMAF